MSYGNTFIYTIGGTLTSLAFLIPGAYALSRPQLYGRRFWNLMVAFTMWFNAGLISFFLNMRDLGLLDSYFGIIVGFAVNGFNLILLRNFFESIPRSFEEAARMDGASELQVLWKVYVPLSKPAIATVALFCIVSRWNGFFWAMVLLQDEDKIPLQVYLRHTITNLSDDEEFGATLLSSPYSVETVTAAIIVCSIVPVLIVYPFIQKYFEKGILLGGVKERVPFAYYDWFASTSSYDNKLQETIDGFEFKAMAPPANVNGERFEEHRRIPIKPDGWAIGASNEHPVETIKYFDFWFSPEGRDLVNFGVEGQQYETVDGEPRFTDEFIAAGPVNSQLYQVGAQLHARGYFQDYEYEKQWSNEYALEGIALYDEGDYLIDQFLGVAFNADEQAVYDRYWPSIRTYMLEKQQAWILGSADVEAEWEGYARTFDRVGYDKVLDAMNSAYERQYAG